MRAWAGQAVLVTTMTRVHPGMDVVIAAYNRHELTDSCLRHLGAQTFAYRVTLVDDGASDDTHGRVTPERPQVTLERLEHNRGFAEACNRRVAAGSQEIVMLLSNDVDCDAGFLQALVAPLQADSQVGSVAALMLQPGERLIDSIGLNADVTLGAFPRLQGQQRRRSCAPLPVLAGPAGTAAARRRSAWQEVGGLDERIFAYMEESELALRLRGPGWQTALTPDAIGVQLGAATYGHRSAWERRHGGFARGYLLRRYGLLRSRGAARTPATEAVVVLGALVIPRDLAALRGRIAGWRAGAQLPRLARPRSDAIDAMISVRGSFALRRRVYGRRAA